MKDSKRKTLCRKRWPSRHSCEAHTHIFFCSFSIQQEISSGIVTLTLHAHSIVMHAPHARNTLDISFEWLIVEYMFDIVFAAMINLLKYMMRTECVRMCSSEQYRMNKR